MHAGDITGTDTERRVSILPDRITTPTLRSFLRSVPSVDEVGANERVAALSTRSIKRESKRAALDSDHADDGPDHARGEGHSGQGGPDVGEGDPPRSSSILSVPSVAAVCVYPNMVKYAVEATEGSSVKVASVATYFPSGLVETDLKVEEVSRVVRLGADEVDMVIDRGAFLRRRVISRSSTRSAGSRTPVGMPISR